MFTVLYGNTVTDALARGGDALTAFTNGYSAAFFASGIAMVVASVIGTVFIRGRKEDLMPQWEPDEAVPAFTH
ncbi:hypothetical protein [Cryobacterium roopkundense]|uniref:Major facilitator superfamily (MFS) profile domain-containing protein n=1 Tax=Cryobacterium roopkundense TaxID=1001240 RepID=A0A7W8ZZK8_9MICO|nr:hypothetical protein [Cryobacterium roopkundense]MBB5642857.1 hypothetical protein [Cryobacterium roopkundense]